MSDWGGVNVLVTGGEGFIGSHLTETLVAVGRQRARAVVLHVVRSRRLARPVAGARRSRGDARRRARRGPRARSGRRARRRVPPRRADRHSVLATSRPRATSRPTCRVRSTWPTPAVAPACRASCTRPRRETYGTGAVRADHRGASAAAAVAVLGVEDRRRHDGAVVAPRVRTARRGRPPVQHLRPAAVDAGGDPDDPVATASAARPR